MTPTSLIIVADRGSLKAYRVDETPTRGPSLRLIQAFDLTDAHGKLVDKVTDLAGRFPVSDGAGGRHANSIAERTQLETETDRRIHKQLADQIVEALRSGKTVVVHCRQGIGRSAMMVAAALITGGLSAETSVNAIRESRGLEVPETQAQRQWISDFSAWLSRRRTAQQRHPADVASRPR